MSTRRRRPVKKINKNMKKKLAVLFSLVVLALIGLVARITYINATSGSKYRKQVLSQAQQKYENQTLPAKRGDIYDRNGNILATSNKVYNVILDCLEVNKDEDSVEPTIKALVEVLGLDEEEMRKLLNDDSTKSSQYQIVKKQISIYSAACNGNNFRFWRISSSIGRGRKCSDRGILSGQLQNWGTFVPKNIEKIL